MEHELLLKLEQAARKLKSVQSFVPYNFRNEPPKYPTSQMWAIRSAAVEEIDNLLGQLDTERSTQAGLAKAILAEALKDEK